MRLSKTLSSFNRFILDPNRIMKEDIQNFPIGKIRRYNMKERIKSLLTREPSSEIITAEGWVRTKRDSKNVCFLEINDGS